jgi:hypothetical protein
VTGLSRAIVSIAPTKRRRYFWAVWWTGEPVAAPFRAPDAFSGGARTPEEARLAAERFAGRSLLDAEAKWARAWARIREGRAPWPAERPRATTSTLPAAVVSLSAYEVLGVAKDATDAQLKRAFHAHALATHPDQGGNAEAFIRVKRAYDSLVARRRKRGHKRP